MLVKTVLCLEKKHDKYVYDVNFIINLWWSSEPTAMQAHTKGSLWAISRWAGPSSSKGAVPVLEAAALPPPLGRNVFWWPGRHRDVWDSACSTPSWHAAEHSQFLLSVPGFPALWEAASDLLFHPVLLQFHVKPHSSTTNPELSPGIRAQTRKEMVTEKEQIACRSLFRDLGPSGEHCLLELKEPCVWS